MSLRSPLGRVLGLDREGRTAHWWAQRVSAVALIRWTLWSFVVGTLPGSTTPGPGVAVGFP